MLSSVVAISPKFQIVLPKLIREALGLEPREKLVVLEKGGQIVLVPLLDLKKTRGALKGVSAIGLRDETERFG